MQWQSSPTRQGSERRAHLLALFALALSIPAILGLTHMLKARRPAIGHVGAGLPLFGTVAFAAIVGTEFVVWQAAKAAETDTAAMTAPLARINDSHGIQLLFLLAPNGEMGGTRAATGPT